jgi:hypothetical protein
MNKLISMSLYGDLSMYIDGARECVRTYKDYYPDYDLRIYVSETIDLDCEQVVMGPSIEHSGMVWRFMPIFEKGLERIIFRDTDSRFNDREVQAIRAWEASGMLAHSMHDHEHHRSYPLFGGMWGIKGRSYTEGLLPNRYNDIVYLSESGVKRVGDMNWLRDRIYPHIINDTLHHTSVELKWPSQPFPEHTEYDGFVGQQWNDDGQVWA